MKFIRNYIEGNEAKWLWYGVTLVGSFLPAIFRFVLSLDINISSFDIKDLLFGGLAVNLSNLNLIGSRTFAYKVAISLSSVFFILLICFFLGIFLFGESDHSNNPMLYLKIISGTLVGVSIYMSYEANNYVFKTVN